MENYVKYLTDHVRSILKGVVKKRSVEDFYANYMPIIRDAILGEKPATAERTGLVFTANNMRVTDVEVLDVKLGNPDIEKMLNTLQYEVVRQNVELQKSRKTLEVTKEQEKIIVETMEARAVTQKRTMELEVEKVQKTLEVELARVDADLKTLTEKQRKEEENQKLLDLSHKSELARDNADASFEHAKNKAVAELAIATLQGETKAAVERLTAAKENLAEALVALSREETLVKVAEAMKIDSFISGNSMEGSLSRVLVGLPFLGKVFENLKSGDREVVHLEAANGKVPVS